MDGLKAGVSHREDYVHTGEYGRVWGRREMKGENEKDSDYIIRLFVVSL